MKKSFRVIALCLALMTITMLLPVQSIAKATISSSVKSVVFNATYYANRYPDLKAAFGTDSTKLYNHFLEYGVKEGRQASPIFNVNYYLTKNSDLKSAFGSDREQAMSHFCGYGVNEIRHTAAVVDLGTNINVVIKMASSSRNLNNDGDNVIVDSVNDAKQTWLLTRQSDGSYKITSNATGKVLDVSGASRSSGANVGLYASNDTNAQRWYIYENQNGSYTLRSKCGTTTVLTASGTSAGANVEMKTFSSSSNQQFRITAYSAAPVEPETPVVPETPSEDTKTPVNLGSDFYATITGVASGKYLGITSNKTVLKSVSKVPSKVWRFKLNNDGTYCIMNENNGYVLDVTAANTAAGTYVNTVAPNSTDAQKWFIYKDTKGYILVSKLSDKCVLTLENTSAADNTRLQINKYTGNTATQQFTFTKINNYLSFVSPTDVGTSFNASVSYSGKNLAVSGTNVIIYGRSQNSDQVWRFERQADRSYIIVNNNTTNKVLAVANASSANGANVQIENRTGAASQRWFIYIKEGKYVFRSALSSTAVLDVYGAGTADLTNVDIWSNNGTPAQLFTITKGNMTAMSFNVYCAQFNTTRTNRVLSMMKSYTPDTIGIQEATTDWMNLLKSSLGDTYAFVGLGRDGGSNGEHSAIMYNKHIFNLVDSGTKWMSNTPDVVSKFSDSSYRRIFTYALLERKTDGERILVVNTHIEYTTDAIRIKQLGVLFNFLASYADYPTIITGDFNTEPTSSTYSYMLSQGYVDSAKAASTSKQANTFTNFGADNRILDYLFASKGNFDLKYYQVCNEKINGNFPSDHHPVFVRYSLK